MLLAGFCLLMAAGARAAVWPDQVGDYKKVASKPVDVGDRPLWDEYGLNLTEQAEYAAGAKHFTGTAFRLQDSTGAFGAFEWQRPAGSKPSKLADAGAETRDGVWFVFGNFLFRLEGWKPQLDDLSAVLAHLPGLDQSALPTVHLPDQGLEANSERYVIGPVGLDRFEKGVQPAVAAFSLGAEVEIGQYDTAAGRMQLAVFSYPTPQIAIQQARQFQSLPGTMAKRAGPMVAVILAPQDPNAAERLLALVRYNGVVTGAERVPTARDNVAGLLITIFSLTGFVLVFCVVAGLAVGVLRRLGWGTSGDPMTLLHLEDRQQGSSQP
ncbi:MAG: DUF6599 family protein [Bryobacteraceae bacterium]|jgi:hypothetical protein